MKCCLSGRNVLEKRSVKTTSTPLHVTPGGPGAAAQHAGLAVPREMVRHRFVEGDTAAAPGAEHLTPAPRAGAGAAAGARAHVSYPGTLNIKPAELLSLAVLDLLLMSSVMSYNLLMVYPMVLAMT